MQTTTTLVKALAMRAGARLFSTLVLSALLMIALLRGPTLLGNVGLFDGSGASITLGNTDKIQMVSEVVEITFIPTDGPVTGDLVHRDKAHYNCRFVLRNLAEETVSAQIGFPLLAQDDLPAPQEHPQLQAVLLEHYGFTAKSGDTTYPVHYQMRDAKNEYRHVFVWDMEFAPGATVELNVSYSIYGYHGLGSTERQPPYFNTNYRKNYMMGLQDSITQMYPYVTKTAGSWAGEVENAQFIIRDADFSAHLQKRGALERKDAPTTPIASRPLAEQIQAIREEGIFYRYISAGTWQPAADGKSLIWAEAPFAEHKDFEIRYIFSIFPKNAEGFTNLLRTIEGDYEQFRRSMLAMKEKVENGNGQNKEERLAKMAAFLKKHYPGPFTDADRKNVADGVLEFYGIATNNPDITDFLEAQNWYPVTEPRAIDPELKAELMRWHTIGQTEQAGTQSTDTAPEPPMQQ